MNLKAVFVSIGFALASNDGVEESSLLQVQRPPSREASLLEEAEDCASGKCKPVTKKTTTTTTTPGYQTTTTTPGYQTTTTTPGYQTTTTTRPATTTTTTTKPATTTTTTTTTKPATTTTAAPPVDTGSECTGVSCETVCSGSVLKFSEEQIKENTLVGGGTMKIAGVLEGIDLHITGESGDDLKSLDSTSGKSSWNSAYKNPGEFMALTGIYQAKQPDGTLKNTEALRVAMESTGTYKFKFAFKDATTGDAVKLDEFPLVFYDMDYFEQVKACGVAGDVLDKETQLTKESNGDCVTFKAGSKAATSPDDFDNLTPDQKKATAAFIFEKTSEWTMEFTLKYYSHRWVLFKSSKALACQGS